MFNGCCHLHLLTEQEKTNDNMQYIAGKLGQDLSAIFVFICYNSFANSLTGWWVSKYNCYEHNTHQLYKYPLTII